MLQAGALMGKAVGMLIPPIIIKGPVNTFNYSVPSNWSLLDEFLSERAIEEVHYQKLSLALTECALAVIVFALILKFYKDWIENTSKNINVCTHSRMKNLYSSPEV